MVYLTFLIFGIYSFLNPLSELLSNITGGFYFSPYVINENIVWLYIVIVFVSFLGGLVLTWIQEKSFSLTWLKKDLSRFINLINNVNFFYIVTLQFFIYTYVALAKSSLISIKLIVVWVWSSVVCLTVFYIQNYLLSYSRFGASVGLGKIILAYNGTIIGILAYFGIFKVDVY